MILCKINNIEWFSVIIMVIAGVSLSAKLPNFEYAFLLLFIGHATLVATFALRKEIKYALLNGFYGIIDCIGITNWIL